MIRENYRDAECCYNCNHLISDEDCNNYCNLNNDCPPFKDIYQVIQAWKRAHGTMEHYVCDSFKE